MEKNERIRQADLASLRVLRYPDPRLAAPNVPVDEIDDSVRALVDRMYEVLEASRGVGLAAPQIGVNVRLFVACPSGRKEDRRAYVNPQLLNLEGAQEDEEGCLSLPGIYAHIKRYDKATIRATDLDGREFEETGKGLLARIFQHESDHLDGHLIKDRMGSVARLAHRKALKSLEEKYEEG
jgi:peptide deformylase